MISQLQFTIPFGQIKIKRLYSGYNANENCRITQFKVVLQLVLW